jgi:hypothetical protein
MAEIDRREFMRKAALVSAAATAVLGMPAAAKRAHHAGSVASWDAVLTAMQKHRQFGVALTLPPEQQQQQHIGRILHDFMASESYGATELMSLYRWFCMPEQTLKQKVEAIAGHNLHVIDWDAQVVRSAALPWGKVSNVSHLIQELDPLLRDGELLKNWQQRALADLPAPEREALAGAVAGLDAGRAKDRRTAYRKLAGHMPAAAPLVVATRMRTDSIEVRESCRELVKRQLQNNGKTVDGCPAGNMYEFWGGAGVACGMAFVTPEGQALLAQVAAG